MIPEREQEALMRLTMCAREECSMCKYKYTCDFAFRFETTTRCMNILADALRKTENSSEKPNNCETCRHWYTRKDIYDLDDAYCELFYDNAPCKYEPMDEPRTSEIIEAYSRGFRDGAEAVKAVKIKALHEDYIEPYVTIEDEPQTIRCPKCGRTDYIRDMEKDMGIKGSHYKYKCINCNTYIKDKPQTETKMKTQNSNLTFEKRTMRDCYNCKRYETESKCIECKFEPKDEPQTERSE